MGQHRQSLEIYVFKMKDFVKAEEFVARTLYGYLTGTIADFNLAIVIVRIDLRPHLQILQMTLTSQHHLYITRYFPSIFNHLRLTNQTSSQL